MIDNQKNNGIEQIIEQAKNKYKDINIQLNNELKKFLNEYNKHVEDIKRLKNDLLNELSKTKNFQKTNDDSVVNDLYNNSVDIENKSVNELINLLMDSCHYNLPKLNIEEELKLNFFINVVKNIELKTNENYVSNFLYSNLYEKLSDEEITKIFNDIKLDETNNTKTDSLMSFSNLEEEYNYFANLYYERFGKKAFIANPGGSKEQTIYAIKKSLAENKDLLGDLLNPNDEGTLY